MFQVLYQYNKEKSMLIEDVKKTLYNILTQDLGYTVVDNSSEENNCPWIRLRTSNLYRQPFKNNEYEYNITYTLDIFSEYDGEHEILEMDKEIFEKMPKMYELDCITNISGSNLKIIDDKSTGVIKKHGILSYTFSIMFKTKEVEDETDTSGE